MSRKVESFGHCIYMGTITALVSYEPTNIMTLYDLVNCTNRDILLTRQNSRTWKLKNCGTVLKSGRVVSFVQTVDPDGSINHFLNNGHLVVMSLSGPDQIRMDCNGVAYDYSYTWM